MKALDLYMLLFASLPIMASAQTSDDLYYTPKKKTQVQQRTTVVQQSANPAISEVRITPDHVTVIKGDKASDTVPPVNMEHLIQMIIVVRLLLQLNVLNIVKNVIYHRILQIIIRIVLVVKMDLLQLP